MTEPGHAPQVVLRGVVKTYRRAAEPVHALRGIDAEVRAGEVLALMGPSGSGKSTLLFVLAGWERADAGTVELAGSLTRDRLDALPWRDLSLVPQALGLLEDLTIAENVALPARLAGVPDPDRLERLLLRLDLGPLAARRPAETSLGEQQRAAVARALLLQPAVVLADEPSTHQDVRRARLVFEALREAADAGAAVVVATHDDEALAYVDRVLEVRDGLLHSRSLD